MVRRQLESGTGGTDSSASSSSSSNGTVTKGKSTKNNTQPKTPISSTVAAGENIKHSITIPKKSVASVATISHSNKTSDSTIANKSSGPSPGLSHVRELSSSSTIVAAMLKIVFIETVQSCKQHFMMSKTPTPFKVTTAAPFLKAVDCLQYPDYAQIVSHPMNLTQMEKKITANKYTLSLSSAVAPGKTVRLSSFLGLPSYTTALLVRPPATMPLVSAGVEAIWLFRKDMELLRNNAHAYNVGKFSELSLLEFGL